MKVLLLCAIVWLAAGAHAQAQLTRSEALTMKLNAGIVTTQLEETRAFYKEVLDFGVTFENEFYLLMHTAGHTAEVSFLLPHHPSQHALFQKPFQQQGVYLTIEVDNADSVYTAIKAKGVPIIVELRDGMGRQTLRHSGSERCSD
jgi:catechol 2,3-dioxygenase-like lactoylglutathione lyase family enzyme